MPAAATSAPWQSAARKYLLDTDSIANTVAVKGPQGLLVDSGGNVFFANTLDMEVWEIESNLAALDFTATPVRPPSRFSSRAHRIGCPMTTPAHSILAGNCFSKVQASRWVCAATRTSSRSMPGLFSEPCSPKNQLPAATATASNAAVFPVALSPASNVKLG